MGKNKIIAAIDIGSSKITTLIAQLVVDQVTLDSSLNIVGVAVAQSKGVKKGQIVDIEDAVEATILSVEAAERMAGYNLNSAFISVAGGHIGCQNSTGVVAVSDPNGEVTPGDVERVIEGAKAVSLPTSREIIHVIPRQFTVDGEQGVKDPVGMAGVRLEVDTHLVTASAAALKNLSKTVNEVGIKIDEAVFSGLASSFTTLTETEKELGCVLVDIGAGTTSVAAFVDGSLSYSSSIPIGARNVTNDLAIGLRVSLESAEKIKLALSSKKKQGKVEEKAEFFDIGTLSGEESKKVSRRTLVEGIIKPRLNEIFTMVKLDLEKSNIINRIPSGAIITGGGSQTVGLLESAKKTLALPVRIGIPTGVTGLIDDIGTPAFSTAVGLILYAKEKEGFKEIPQKNFAPKIKMPTKGIHLPNKIIDIIKNLLP
ncbi:cell division protein FtsA [Candidatus Woesebacteria bacterium]|nr:cell division protein FtsA [Candidatus Woesebacteria bacterium]QQG47136.1 MAG: cell division protein FtsA [Candidatus Woesebacteria bacterium]